MELLAEYKLTTSAASVTLSGFDDAVKYENLLIIYGNAASNYGNPSQLYVKVNESATSHSISYGYSYYNNGTPIRSSASSTDGFTIEGGLGPYNGWWGCGVINIGGRNYTTPSKQTLNVRWGLSKYSPYVSQDGPLVGMAYSTSMPVTGPITTIKFASWSGTTLRSNFEVQIYGVN